MTLPVQGHKAPKGQAYWIQRKNPW